MGAAVWELRRGRSASDSIAEADQLIRHTPLARHMLRTIIAAILYQAGQAAAEGWLREADAFRKWGRRTPQVRGPSSPVDHDTVTWLLLDDPMLWPGCGKLCTTCSRKRALTDSNSTPVTFGLIALTTTMAGDGAVGQCEAWARLGTEFSFNEMRACWKMGGQPLAQRLTILLVRTSVHRADALHLLSNLCQSEKEPSGSGSGEVEHEREDEDDCPGPDGIHDQVAGLPPFEAGEGHAATQEAEEQPG
jgi:hypothetical protein